MKIGLLAEVDAWHSSEILRAAGQRGHKVIPLDFRRIRAALSPPGSSDIRFGEVVSTDCDVVFVRTVPAGTLDQIVFRMDALAELARIGVPVINPARSIEACVDKFLSLCLMQRAGLPVPRTLVAQTADDARVAFQQLGNRAVLKPVFGSEGRGVMLLDNEDLAQRAFRLLESFGQTIYLQEFIDHGNRDRRLFVCGEEVIGMHRENPLDWRVNASRGSSTVAAVVDDRLRELAIHAARSVGAVIAGVDLVEDREGQRWILEINSAPGWKRLAETLSKDVAGLIVDELERQVG